MRDRTVFAIENEVLLRDIGLVGTTLLVLRQKMIEGLVLRRPPLRRNGFIPFLGIVEDRIDVENDAAKRIEAVADDLSDREFAVAEYPRRRHCQSSCPAR